MGHQKVTVVLNASVFLAAMLLDEPKEVSDGAMRILLDIDSGKVIAHVPDRFEDEVLGGLVEAISKGRPVSVTVFATFLHFREKFRVHSRSIDWCAEEVFQAALRWRVSYYDALYLVVAQKVGATYWTADRKLLRFLQHHRFPNLPLTAWIGDYR